MEAIAPVTLLSASISQAFSFFGGGYDEVNRRFEFTFHNSTGISLHLKSQDGWYGFLESPDKIVPPDGKIKIRGYKRADNATGVTYVLAFQFDPKEIMTAHVLYVYL